jgi:hypothetical protein
MGQKLKNLLWRINVHVADPAANSLKWCANLNHLIYTGKLISAHSDVPVLSASALVVQNLQFSVYGFEAGH